MGIGIEEEMLPLVLFIIFGIALMINIFALAKEKYGQHAEYEGRKKQLLNLNAPGPGIEIRNHSVDGLLVSTKEIAKGSNGTVIFEGEYEGRKVAVKRSFKTHRNEASEEVQHLVASDKHPNIVRCHGVKYDKDYVYVVLERCICSLSDLISLHTDPHPNSDCFCHQAKGAPWSTSVKNINLWKSNGYPSALLLKLMRDMVYGLVHLHKLGIIHQGIKPENVMIAEGKDICAKLSDIGVSKCLSSDTSFLSRNATGSGSSGWQASEQTQAGDMFSLGCVFLFCLSRGVYPSDEEDINTVNSRIGGYLAGNSPEAIDLLSCLLDPAPQMRPTAFQVSFHPLFWDSEKRLSFMRLVSDRLQSEVQNPRSDFLKDVESRNRMILGKKCSGWNKKMQQELLVHIRKYNKYPRYNSVQDLLRVVRNSMNHYYDSPQEIQALVGSMPEGLDNYFRTQTRFPSLLMEVYKVVKKHCRSEEAFKKYFEPESVDPQ